MVGLNSQKSNKKDQELKNLIFKTSGPFKIQYSPNENFNILFALKNQLDISLPETLNQIIAVLFSNLFLVIVASIMM